MSSLVAMRKTASASLLFKKSKFLKSGSAAAVRSFATTNKAPPAASDGDDDKVPVIVKGPPQKFKMENPFQLDGPRNVLEVDELKGVALVRVAMPGVEHDGIRVWAENNTVFFAGKGEIELESEESGRKYGGSLEFSPELYRPDEFKAEMVNGILRLLVPNVEGKDNKE